jgi:hypothetical protein
VTAVSQMDRRTVNSYLRDKLGTKAITDLFTQMFFYLPKTEIKAGASWVKNFQLIARAPVKYSKLVSVSNIQGDSVTLLTQAAISAKAGEGGAVYAEGKQKGVIIASYKTGIPISSVTEENIVTHTDSKDVRKTQQTTIRLVARRRF